MSVADPLAGAESPQKVSGLRIGIIMDWSQCHRGVFWPGIFDQLAALQTYPPVEIANWFVYPLGDHLEQGIFSDPRLREKVASQSEESHPLRNCDVIIINWDSLNGDPAFGSDYGQRWFSHHRPELLWWVREGGILIIEGQTSLSVPSQDAYDALLGRGELPVSGPEKEMVPTAQTARMGYLCELTEPGKELFGNPSDVQPYVVKMIGHIIRCFLMIVLRTLY